MQMIKIVLPATDVDQAVVIRDRVRGTVLEVTDRAYIGTGGVWIETADPVRVVRDLAYEGFIDG
jgi:hypothetical protein